MSLRTIMTTVVVAAAAATAAAMYSPQAANRLLPGAGDKAMQLRALIPEDIRSKIGLVNADAVNADAGNTGDSKAASPDPGAAKSGAGGHAGAPQRPPPVVMVASAERKPVAVRIDAIGTVQAVASVALRTRIDAQVDHVLVADGAAVKAGDVLIKLDARQVEALLKQAQAQLAKDQTALEQSTRDVGRYTDLVNKQAGTQLNLDNAKTAVAAARAAILGDQAAIENLSVQLSWYTLTAPISGRVGTVALKVGNIARSGDSGSTGTLVTINQTTPIYVAFSVPQRLLPDLREAMTRGDAKMIATPQGAKQSVEGNVAVIDNAIDAATGTIMVRGIFANPNEALWPGQLCDVRVTLRVDPDTVTVPREAVQVGQNGHYVYAIDDGVAKVKSVKVGRTQDGESVITEGLNGNEMVVTDGALLLTNGTKVEVRSAAPKKSAS